MIDSGKNIIERLKSLSNGDSGIPFKVFEPIFREAEILTVGELSPVVSFASNQVAYWMAEYLFSPIHSPNTVAAEEAKEWRQFRNICMVELAAQVPEVQELLERQQRLIEFGYALKRGLKLIETKPFQRLKASLLSRISLLLNKLGFKSIAMSLYTRAMYPKGTVGRIEG